MHRSRFTFPAFLSLLIALLAPASSGAAAIDPERNLAQPVPWQWASDLSTADINARKADGWRLTDIGVERREPYRFTGVFVRNSGSYERDWNWFPPVSRAGVEAFTKGQGRRLVDLEPVEVDGERRFAIVTVKNEGEAAKEWGWNADLTPAQITAETELYGLRIVDLDSYLVDGRRLYSYAAVKNQGVDAREWWWYTDVTLTFANRMLAENGARLVDIEWLSHGFRTTKVSVAMVKNTEGTFTQPVVATTGSRLDEIAASNGMRLAAVERHKNVSSLWTGVLIDNVPAESARLRSIVRATPYGSAYFGVFAKRVGGPTYVGLAHQRPYQPMSVLKLIPHLYVMDLLDRGKVDLDRDTISWSTPSGDPEALWCTGTSGSVHVGTLKEALILSLWASRNPVHEGLVRTYGRGAILDRVHALGLTGTQLYPGCERAGALDWRSNRTTLAEMGWLFEGVDTQQFFPNRWLNVRNQFYGLMVDWPAAWFRPVVAEEAAKLGKSGLVDPFVRLITMHGKAGSIDIKSGDRPWLAGRALSYRVSFPAKKAIVQPDGSVVRVPTSHEHVGGFFVNDLVAPCHEATAAANPGGATAECLTFVREMEATQQKLVAEAQRTAIRQALETW